MDASTSRQLIQLLVGAAASGNAALRSSMMSALDRQPAEARKPLLEEALSQTSTPKAREALEEALARVR